MNNKLSKIKCIAIFLTGISAASIPSLATADWSIVGLGTLGRMSSGAYDINDSGQVVGYYYNDGGRPSRAFITGPNGTDMRSLDIPIGSQTSAGYGINNSGQVVGYYDYNNDGDRYHAFITGTNGVGMTDLGTLNGGVNSAARGINDSGQVTGYYLDSYGDYKAFITGVNGVDMTDLGTLEGKSTSVAYDINNSGQVVGASYTPSDSNYHMRAFITGSNGVDMADLGAPDRSAAYAINNFGQAAGSMTISSNSARGFITGANGEGITELGTMGGDRSFVLDINDSGQAVGMADYADGGGVSSFIYSNGIMVNLSYLDSVIEGGWTDLYASAINNNGQIVGSGMLHGVRQAFLLSGADEPEFYLSYTPFPLPYTPPPQPIPEPETYAMLLAGLGLLGFMARRRNESAV